MARTKKPARYKISVWHGEGKSLFYVIRNGSVVKTFHRRDEAEAYIASKAHRQGNPSFGLPRNKWVNARIRVTSGGKIQAAVSEDILGGVGRLFGGGGGKKRAKRRRNPTYDVVIFKLKKVTPRGLPTGWYFARNVWDYPLGGPYKNKTEAKKAARSAGYNPDPIAVKD